MKNQVLKFSSLAILVAAIASTPRNASAHPYASAVTNDTSIGKVKFIMNEGGATVNVVFEDNTTNAMGVLPRGATNFTLGSHTSFQIICTKLGNGTPSLISVDSDQWSTWANPRGVSVNRNPKSTAFGRIYAGSVGTGGFAFGTPGYKPQGVFWFNADYSTGALGTNQTPAAGFFGSSGPMHLRVCPDDDVLVGDFSGSGSLYKFSPDLTSRTTVFSTAQPAGIHGDGRGTAFMTGTLADGNLTLYVPDGGMGIPNTVPTLGPSGTTPWGSTYSTAFGMFNNLYRYDIGAGPIPVGGWPNPPNYAYNMGLSTIQELRVEADIGKDGKIIAGFGRGNLSNPDIQILSPDGLTYLWDSWANTGGISDQWNGTASGQGGVGTEGIRVSPDGQFLASVDFKSGITIALLTNGIPDEGSIFTIQNAPNGANTTPTSAAGIDWDAADNLYVNSRGQLLLRTYSMGISTTCITSNDFTGTHGSFQMILPSAQASGSLITGLASQNYTNNAVNPGNPIPGVFRISLNQSILAAPVTVNYTTTGTAVYGPTNHFVINTNETPNGVVITPNSVTFPGGVSFPPGGNWYVDLKITPTKFPVSTNTLTVIVTVIGGPAYQSVPPLKGTIAIQNTGPQLLLLTAAANGTTMYRGITNDYAKFIITRLGDTNGPGNTSVSISPSSYTVTNVTYFGTAVFPTDYAARAQRLDPAGNGAIVPPVPGPTAIVINPGDSVVTCAIGNPFAHTDLTNPVTDVTIIANLTNQVSGAASTNGLLSQEGTLYNVNTAQVTLTELDNRTGPEVLLYANSLTNAADSSWTLTFNSTNSTPGHLPLVLPNYVNDFTSVYGGSTNDFLVEFGTPIASDGIDPTIAMVNNGWNSALKMTVDKNGVGTASVNVYPQGLNAMGNYALRFSMYLSLLNGARDNPGGSFAAAAREFALFGVNHNGTNCIWRPDVTLAGGGVINTPTNSDGIWFAVDEGAGSVTPADYESYLPGAVPNNANGTLALPSKASTPALGVNGIFKHPPFLAANVTTPTIATPGGGQAANQWVDVSVEITKQTNVTMFINRSQILNLPATNGSAFNYTNGTIMLGYQDPNPNGADNSAFAYFSNVRVVELSPFINLQSSVSGSGASSTIVLAGSSLTFTSSATFASAPITNVWYKGTGPVGNPGTGTPTVALQTNSVNATSMTDSLTRTINTAIDATNYMSVFSDSAGSVTSRVVAVELVLAPASKTVNAGTTTNLTVTFAGPVAPTVFQWYFNTSSNFATATKLTNNTHYAGATTATLTLTNTVAPGDVGFYWAATTNAAGGVIPQAATLAVTVGPSSAVVSPASQTNLWGSTATFTVSASGTAPFTYRWKKAGVNLNNGGNVAGATTSALALSSLTTSDAGSYTAGVTNAAGGVISSAGLLTVFTPSPTINGVSLSGGNVVLSFSSTNSFDTSSAFILLSSPVVQGPYTTNTSAIFSGSAGSFQVTSPQTGDSMFYKLQHAN